jgi:hypothetical protein
MLSNVLIEAFNAVKDGLFPLVGTETQRLFANRRSVH